LRFLYHKEDPGAAARHAYGMSDTEDILAFLLKLNLDLADKESHNKPITPPGLPPIRKIPRRLRQRRLRGDFLKRVRNCPCPGLVDSEVGA